MGGDPSAAQEAKIHKAAEMNNVARKQCEVQRGRNGASFIGRGGVKEEGRGKWIKLSEKFRGGKEDKT